MKPTVYIETSVISYLCSRPSRDLIAAARQRLATLSGCKVLEVSESTRLLARRLLDAGILPANSGADALHIAVASVHRAEFLLTWNYRHIANATHRKRMIAVIESAGYECPVICNPEELMEI